MSELIDSRRSFNGVQNRYRHHAASLGCEMQLSVYLPDAAAEKPLPVVYWLSGLTCNDRNFVEKAGAQRIASELGLILVCPDTSPRGDNVADDASDSLGQGAGFYINATQAPWSEHYRMADYVTIDLPQWVQENLPTNGKQSIAGHSMGGHGAIMLSLKHPELYLSVSAFSPIANPCDCPWGEGAFSHYLGDDKAQWQAWDSKELLEASGSQLPIRVDIGRDDPFFENQLKVERLEAAALQHQAPLTVHYHDGFDHSYFFIATYIEAQLRFHAEYLK